MSIGNCPGCGGQCDDENEYCMDCQLQQIALDLPEDFEALYFDEHDDDDNDCDHEFYEGGCIHCGRGDPETWTDDIEYDEY